MIAAGESLDGPQLFVIGFEAEFLSPTLLRGGIRRSGVGGRIRLLRCAHDSQLLDYSETTYQLLIPAGCSLVLLHGLGLGEKWDVERRPCSSSATIFLVLVAW
jgi:hypothetical protein